MRRFLIRGCAAAVVGACWNAPVFAITDEFKLFGENISAVMNNSFTAGAQFRLHDRADYLVGKSDLNPTLCAGQYQLCQGVIRGQSYPAEHLRAAPGQGSMNFDDGNLNYDKGDVVQAPLVLTTDLKLNWSEYELFVRGRGVYDPVNYNFTETHPNKLTRENYDSVVLRGDPFANRYYPEAIDNGGLVHQKRPHEIAKEYRFYDLLDFNISGPIHIGDQDITFRLGRQIVNWGESTVAIVNSLSQANPVNANNIYRLGNALLEDLFIPINMLSLSYAPLDGLTVGGFYQFEWKPAEIPPPGSFYSFLDAGTKNLGSERLNASFGGGPDDFDKLGRRFGNPLDLVASTTLTVGRLPDDKARDSGQYGINLSYYAEDFNNGTQFGLYFMNYHSKLPYIDVYSSNASCMRSRGNPQGRDALNTFDILSLCPNLNVTRPQADGGSNVQVLTRGTLNAVQDLLRLVGERPETITNLGVDVNGSPLDIVNGLTQLLVYQPGKPLSEVIPFDSANVRLTYPEDLKMYGFSFNTTYGDYSFQGEVAYRPDLPLQVAVVDLAFAAMGPTLGSCNATTVRCDGTAAAVGYSENSTGRPATGQPGVNYSGEYVTYDQGDVVDANGRNPYKDTAFLLLAGVPNSSRSFPNFIIPFRGGTLGDNPPNSRIKGYIRRDVLQYTLGATRVYSASENWIGADQVIMLYELAGTQVLNMPDFDKLQIEGPFTAYTHASAGADGSGANGSRLACSTNPACSIGPDGIRFNPYQASRDQFANAFSWGYRVVGRIVYESVFPSISIAPLLLWQHDINGNSPAPHFNFVEGRYSLTSILEFRYEKAASVSLVYNLYGGGGQNNLYADRDNLGFYVKYQF